MPKALDGGTTHWRIFFGDDLQETLRINAGDWAAFDSVAASGPTLIGGMVTSQGRYQTGYRATIADVACPVNHWSRFDEQVFALPGVVDHANQDMMRGEDAELAGLDLTDGWVLSPGTHNKWILLENGKICVIRSFVTGDIREQLMCSRTLGALIARDSCSGSYTSGFFEQLSSPQPLTQWLFQLRYRWQHLHWQSDQLSGWLNGALLADEWRVMRQYRITDLTVIGEQDWTSSLDVLIEEGCAIHRVVQDARAGYRTLLEQL